MRNDRIIWTLIALNLCLLALRLCAQVPLPPAPLTFTNAAFIKVGTNIYVRWTPPAPKPTAIVLSWNPYTNLQTVVQESTDLTNWQEIARVPIGQTSVSVPATNPFEVYRIYLDYSP